MKCQVCKRSFKQDEKIVPVMKYVETNRRGDFVANGHDTCVHLSHLITREQ